MNISETSDNWKYHLGVGLVPTTATPGAVKSLGITDVTEAKEPRNFRALVLMSDQVDLSVNRIAVSA